MCDQGARWRSSDRTSGEGDLESGQTIGVGHIEQRTELVVTVLMSDAVNGGLHDFMAAQFLYVPTVVRTYTSPMRATEMMITNFGCQVEEAVVVLVPTLYNGRLRAHQFAHWT